MKLRVLLTDGVNKNTLAILRSLGHKYIFDILTFRPRFLTLSGYSKYVNKVYRIDMSSDESYFKELITILKKNSYDIFLPVGLRSYVISSRHRDEILKYTNAMLPRWDFMKIAFNKDLTMKFARDIGVPVPQTEVLKTPKLPPGWKYPVVIKSSDGSGKFVKYCKNSDELRKNYEYLKKKSNTNIIIQDYIVGCGVGFYGVCKNGKLYAIFMHKRIKEFPITGGPSAVAESYYSKKLLKYGKKIARELKWDGPFMAEFKYSKKRDEYFLIEINPKLWGSLDLTIKAGINVPQILIDLALGKKINFPINDYRKVRYRWVFPDEFKVLMSGGETFKEFFKKTPETYTNLDFSDPLPTVFQIAKGIYEGFLVAVNKERKFPHGVVEW